MRSFYLPGRLTAEDTLYSAPSHLLDAKISMMLTSLTATRMRAGHGPTDLSWQTALRRRVGGIRHGLIPPDVSSQIGLGRGRGRRDDGASI
jgi:hypothetical protein